MPRLRGLILSVVWWVERLVKARPDPKRHGRCYNCRGDTPLFVEACPTCGCTGMAEYRARCERQYPEALAAFDNFRGEEL